MKRVFAGLSVLLIALFACLPVGNGQEEVYLSVQDGVLSVQGQQIRLNPSIAKPILVTMDPQSNVVLVIQTPSGETTMQLGNVILTMSPETVGYVRIAEAASQSTAASSGKGGSGGSSKPKQYQDTCPYCGRSNYNMAHVCPICGAYFCKHDEIACYYIANPRPSPWSSKGPDGKVLYSYIAPDGSYVAGNPDGSKEELWRPELFMPTPSPSPTPWP